MKKALEVEVKRAGMLLGYCGLHKKIRAVHGLSVPTNVMYDVVMNVNREAMESRGGVGEPRRPKRIKVFMVSVKIKKLPLYLS